MKKIYVNILILSFSSVTLTSLKASESSKATIPFNIPMQHNYIDFKEVKLPPCTGYDDASDHEILSAISKRVAAYLQCIYIPYYEAKEQDKLKRLHFFIQKKNGELTNETQTDSKNLNKFDRKQYAMNEFERNQYILINRLHDLQKYKEVAHERFMQRENKRPAAYTT